MKLTREEQEMLDGKHGDAVQQAMELLVAVGECYDAQEMVRVSSAHLSSANPVSAGKGGKSFIKEMAEKGGKFVIPTTINPACLEPWAWREMGFSEEFHQEHLAFNEVIAKMDGLYCNSCTPYLIGHVPRFGEHIAWCESSALIYANAVLGSRTNREGAPTGLAAGITGRTPYHGYHLQENRYGTLKIMVNTTLRGESDYGILGDFAGRIALNRVPIFTGIPPSVSRDELKCLGAALPTSGSVTHYHVVGVTPEAPTEEIATGPNKIGSSDTFEFGPRELKETGEAFCRAAPEETNLFYTGCPHVSIEEVKKYAQILAGRKLKNNVDFWITITHAIKTYAEDIGYAQIIEASGARLLSNTCPNSMGKGFFKKLGYQVVATDSPKMAYYIPTTQDVRLYYGRLEDFIDVVTTKT